MLTSRPVATRILVLTLAAIVFVGGLGEKHLVTSHEARVAQTARFMANAGWPGAAAPARVPLPVLSTESGMKRFRESNEMISVNPWIIPMINGQLRLNKPPLPYWCSAVAFKLFGVNEFSARLPSAILGVMGTLLMLELGRALFSSRVGLIAGLLWISSYFVVDEFRKSMADPYLAFFTLLAIMAFVKSRRWWILCYTAIGLGVLAKGPVIFLTTLPPMIVLTNWSEFRWRWAWRHIAGAVLVLAIALPWAWAVTKQVPNAKDLWLYDAFESVEKARPFWMYFVNLFQLTLPWTPFWIVGVVLPFLHRKRGVRRSVRFRILLWAAIILIAFSIKPVKKNAYLLPMMPALILMSADAIAVTLRTARRFPARAFAWTMMSICAAIGIGFACAIAGFAMRNYPSKAIAVVTSIAAIFASALPLREILRAREKPWFIAQAAGFGVILVLFLSIWNATIENARSPAPIAIRALEYSQKESVPIALGPAPEEVTFYLPLNLPDWRSSDRVLLVLDRPSKEELEDHDFIQSRFSNGIVTSWGVVLRDARYVVVEVLLNRNRA
jgi:4-amino-4-deoxy-L-arabinose transferase-like glycosyltransferase